MAASSSASRLLSWLILILGAVTVCLFCLKAVWTGDDMDYGFVMTRDYIPIIERVTGEETPEPVEDLGDIVRSQTVHWQEVNGRALAHVIIQFFCGIAGQKAFSVCNALVFIAFMWLILRLGGIGMRAPVVTLAMTGLYFLVFVLYMTPASQICYIWMFSIAMTWLLWLFSPRSTPHWALPAAFILGLLAGNGSEALNVGLSIALFLWWLRNLRRITLAQYVLLAGYAAGCAILVFSPGNFARAGQVHFHLLMVPFWGLYFLWILPLLAVMAWRRWHDGIGFRAMYRKDSFWFDTMVASVIFAMSMGGWTNRMFMGAALASFILIVRLLPASRRLTVWIAVCASALAVMAVVSEWQQLVYYRTSFDRITRTFEENGGGEVRVPPYLHRWFFPSFMSYALDIPSGSERVNRSWRAAWRTRYPSHKPLIALPEAYPAVTDSVREPYAVRFGDFMWICIRPTGSDTRFMDHNSIGLWNIIRRYNKSHEIDFTIPSDSTDGWEALIINCEYPFRFLSIDSITTSAAPNAQTSVR